jgi:hypothetical protein
MWLKEAHVIVLFPHGSQHFVAAKVSWITSWVLVCSLPWAQHMKWIPIWPMGCVHTHQGMPTIEGWGSPSCVWSVVEKSREDNQKARKIGWVVSQPFALRPKHDKIQARWALNILLQNMLEKVWWCRRFEMESWSWTICCLMSCSSGGRHTWARGDKRSHVALRCYWKRNVLLSIHAKTSRKKEC